MTEQQGISRRHLVTGATVGGLAAAMAMPGVAGAVPARHESGRSMGTPEAIPARTPGLSYLTLGREAFHGANPASPPTEVNGTLYSTYGVYAPIPLPAGTRIREVSVWVSRPNSSFSDRVALSWTALDLSGVSYEYIVVPTYTNLGVVSKSVDITIIPDNSYSIGYYLIGVGSARIGYQNTGSYVPVSPFRCYDSRYVSPGTQLAPSSSRSIDVTQEINASGIVVATGKIPSTARAVTFNMTAAGATGANNFAAVAGNVSSSGTSHINFNSLTPTVANAGTVDISVGTMKVICGSGAGSAHCLVDITGYYV